MIFFKFNLSLLTLSLFISVGCSNIKNNIPLEKSNRRLANQFSCSESFITFYQSSNNQKMIAQNELPSKFHTQEIQLLLDQYSPKDRILVIESLNLMAKKFPDFSAQQIKIHFKLLERYCGI